MFPKWLEDRGNDAEYKGHKFPEARTLEVEGKRWDSRPRKMAGGIAQKLASQEEAAKARAGWRQAEAGITNQMKIWAEENAARHEAEQAAMSPMRRRWENLKRSVVFGDRHLYNDAEGSATSHDPHNCGYEPLNERAPHKAAEAKAEEAHDETPSFTSKKHKWTL